MLLTTLLLALWVLAVSPAVAQVQVEQVGEETTPEVKGASESEIIVAQGEGAVQDGDVTALLPAKASGLASTDGNSASIFQDGSNNEAQIRQVGTGNRTGIVQRGTDNRAGIRLDGSYNTMNLVQTGGNNEYLMDVEADGMERTVVQNGDSNVLETNVPVNAEMNGNGIELVIRRDAFGPLSLE